MNKQKYIIIFIVLFLGLGFCIYQYSETFKTEIVSATSTVPNPGHLWSSMECNSDTLCVDATNKRLGIGTTAPGSKLQIDISSNATVVPIVSVGSVSATYKNTDTTLNNVTAHNFQNSNGVGVAQFGAINGDRANNNGQLFFAVKNTSGTMIEAMRIASSGNVGIGTTSPGYKLDVNGGVNATYFNGNLYGRDIRTISPSSELAGTIRLGFTSWTNNNGGPWADYIHFRSYGDSTGGSDNLLMVSKSSVAMRLWQQSFGSTTAYSSYSDITMTPGSDIRLKKNITPITDALNKTLKLNGVNFEWNDKYLSYFGKEDNQLQMGLIAQDVEKVVPEVVLHDKIGLTEMKDVLSIDYGRLSALLIEAIKEQQEEIKNLSGENKSLKKLVCLDHPSADICK